MIIKLITNIRNMMVNVNKLSVDQQLNLNVKLYKAFETCKFRGRWNIKNNSLHQYISLENGASIILKGIRAEWDDVYSFKKDSEVTIKNGIIEYYKNDIFAKLD